MKKWFNIIKKSLSRGIEPTLSDLSKYDDSLRSYLNFISRYEGTFRDRIRLSLERGLKALIEEAKRLSGSTY